MVVVVQVVMGVAQEAMPEVEVVQAATLLVAVQVVIVFLESLAALDWAAVRVEALVAVAQLLEPEVEVVLGF